MREQDLSARREYSEHENNAPEYVTIPGTRRRLKMREIHAGTIKFITKIWQERELAAASVKDGAELASDLVKWPYFSFKEAAALYLNGDLKLRFFWPFLWRWWAFRYTESQMLPIIKAGKKKLPLWTHYEIMAFSMDMRTDVMKMTKQEVLQSRAEQVSDAKQPS